MNGVPVSPKMKVYRTRPTLNSTTLRDHVVAIEHQDCTVGTKRTNNSPTIPIRNAIIPLIKRHRCHHSAKALHPGTLFAARPAEAHASVASAT